MREEDHLNILALQTLQYAKELQFAGTLPSQCVSTMYAIEHRLWRRQKLQAKSQTWFVRLWLSYDAQWLQSFIEDFHRLHRKSIESNTPPESV